MIGYHSINRTALNNNNVIAEVLVTKDFLYGSVLVGYSMSNK